MPGRYEAMVMADIIADIIAYLVAGWQG